MADAPNISPDNFRMLLNWLDPDARAAAAKYETIRARLIRIFFGRGCHEAETLADVTFDRVTAKAAELSTSYVGDPGLYFYGVANNVHHEWLRRQKRMNEAGSIVIESIQAPSDETAEADADYSCLEKCLAELSEPLRNMIVEYYREEKGERIRRRREQANRMGISIGALQIKTSRVRSTLLSCIKECLAAG